MKQVDEKQVFEQLRNLSVEIDRSRIAEMVGVIAKLPPPNNGLFNSLTLKQIIMGSLSSLAIASAVAIFNLTGEPSIRVETESVSEISHQPTPIEAAVEEDYIVTTVTENSTLSDRSAPAPDLSFERLPTLPLHNRRLSTKVGSEQFIPIPAPPFDLTTVESPEPNDTVPGMSENVNAIDNLPSILKQFDVTGKAYISYNSPFSLSKDQARRLRTTTWKRLRQDRLVDAARSYAVIHLTPQDILVNGTPMLPELAGAYGQVFGRYGIWPADRRYVLLYDNLIIVGDFDEEEKFTSGIIFGNNEQSSTEPDCARKFRLTGNINSLQRQLVRKLLQDKLISRPYRRILVHFDGDKVAVDYRRIPENRQREYLAFLDGYGYFPCRTRFIEITEAYIAVGMSTEDGFRGTMSGSADLSRLQYSLNLNKKIKK